MNSFVASTDPAWFEFLSSQPDVDEVNFWTPNTGGGQFRALSRGEPLLFKLRAPYNHIAGGGFFEHYTELPISLAWEAFGIKNGAASLATVRQSIAKLRRDKPRPYEDYVIGCILLVEPFFWPVDQWLPAPEDWHSTIVKGKKYDLQGPIGSKIWNEVLVRLQGRELGRHVAERSRLTVPGGYGAPVPVAHRIGQGTFRALVTDAYGRQCAVTHEKALPALEVAHIRPFSSDQSHHIRNGLLLRSDVHRLFDSGYITVTPEYRVEASGRMREDFNDGENYLRLHGSSILLPRDSEMHPDREALRWHNENCFRGG